MEKRFYLGAGILAIFLILGLLISTAMDRACQPVAEDLEQAADAALAGQLETGKTLARQARKTWQKVWNRVAMVADHKPMDEIDGLFSKIEILADAGMPGDFGACCARLAELVEAVADAHRLNLWNLL